MTVNAGTRFVSVPAEAIDTFLTTKKFTAGVYGHEKTYTRVSASNPALSIVVYSSCATGAEVARGCGEDAIRVVLVGKVGKRTVGLHKTKKILRTKSVEAILERVWDRCGEAAKAALNYGKAACQKCGSVTYADSGRCIDRACREQRA